MNDQSSGGFESGNNGVFWGEGHRTKGWLAPEKAPMAGGPTDAVHIYWWSEPLEEHLGMWGPPAEVSLSRWLVGLRSPGQKLQMLKVRKHQKLPQLRGA